MFRVLSLDGGGIKGIFTAAVLAQLQSRIRHPLLDYFDLVVGTSTGGIIVLGLSAGMSPGEVVTFYREKGRQIFPNSSKPKTWLRSLFAPKYDSAGLVSELEAVFGNRLFGEIDRAIMIPTFDATSGRPVVLKTKYHPDFSDYQTVKISDVALATAAAPTYFRAAETNFGVMLDGGVWANCPAMLGVTEAISVFGKRPKDIAVLSVGTTSTPFFVSDNQAEGGTLDWARPISGLLMHATALGCLSQCEKLCGCLQRLDYVVKPDFSLDDVDAIPKLESLGNSVGRDQVRKLDVFFSRRTTKKQAPSN